MRKRIVLLGLMVVALLPTTGCPGPGALLGAWVLTIDGTYDYGLVLLANGSATSNALGGDLTWEVNGTEFIMRQNNGANSIIYIGRLVNNSSASGAFVRWEDNSIGASGTWLSVKQ